MVGCPDDLTEEVVPCIRRNVEAVPEKDVNAGCSNVGRR